MVFSQRLLEEGRCPAVAVGSPSMRTRLAATSCLGRPATFCAPVRLLPWSSCHLLCPSLSPALVVLGRPAGAAPPVLADHSALLGELPSGVSANIAISFGWRQKLISECLGPWSEVSSCFVFTLTVCPSSLSIPGRSLSRPCGPLALCVCP